MNKCPVCDEEFGNEEFQKHIEDHVKRSILNKPVEDNEPADATVYNGHKKLSTAIGQSGAGIRRITKIFDKEKTKSVLNFLEMLLLKIFFNSEKISEFILISNNCHVYGINFKYCFFLSLLKSLEKIPIIFKLL